jgi:hypothetical protein
MWGHYAGAEKGFVIVYGTEDSKIHVRSPLHILHGVRPIPGETHCHEIGIYQEDHLELHAVKYSRMPPKVNAFHRLIHRFSYSEEESHYDVPLLLGGDAAKKQEAQNGLIKYSDWRYEKEVRTFFPTFEPLPPDVRVLSVSTNNIKALIFGPLMNNPDRVRAVVCCHMMQESSLHPKVGTRKEPFAIFQASRVVDRFGFTLVPLGTIQGEYSGGGILPFQDYSKSNKKDQEYLATLMAQISGRDFRSRCGAAI